MTVKEAINNKLTSDLFYDRFCSDKALVNRSSFEKNY